MPAAVPHNIKQACENASYAEALSQLVEGASKDSVIDDLANGGLPREEATRVVEQSVKLFNEAERTVGASEICIGILFTVIGIGATLGTFLMAMDTGGFFIIWHGAVLYGIVSVARGMRLRKTRKRGIVRDQIYNAREAVLAAKQMDTDAGQLKNNPKPQGNYEY